MGIKLPIMSYNLMINLNLYLSYLPKMFCYLINYSWKNQFKLKLLGFLFYVASFHLAILHFFFAHLLQVFSIKIKDSVWFWLQENISGRCKDLKFIKNYLIFKIKMGQNQNLSFLSYLFLSHFIDYVLIYL